MIIISMIYYSDHTFIRILMIMSVMMIVFYIAVAHISGVARHFLGEGFNLQHSAEADFHYFNQHFQHYHDDDHHHDHDDHNAHQVSEPESAPDQRNSDNLSHRTAPVS